MSYAALAGALVLTGIGNSSVFPPISAAIAASVGHEAIGPAAGINNAVREIGGVLGIAVVTLAFTAAGSFRTPAAVTHGFAAAIGLCAVIALAGAVAGLLVPGLPHPAPPAGPSRTPGPAQPGTTAATALTV